MADDPNVLTLGRGRVYFDQFAKGTNTPTGERYFGFTSGFTLSNETEELDYYSMEEGFRDKTSSVSVQNDLTGQLMTEQVNPKNLSLFFFGSASTLTQTALSAQTETFTAKQGLFYPLGVSAANPSGFRQVTVTSVTSDSGNTTHVLDTDYKVDAAQGRIEIVDGGGIAEDTEIVVTFDVTASTREQVLSGVEPIRGRLRFISANAAGKDRDYFMPSAVLRPNGELALKGEEWQMLTFNVEVLKPPTGPKLIIDGRAAA